MANGSIVDVGTGTAQTIGRYFSIISVIPSSLYVVFVYVLITSNAWHHSPDWSRAFTSLERLGFGGIAVLALLSIALGVIIHPVQFAMVQFFEGYWGNTRIAQAIRSQRIRRYQLLCQDLTNKQVDAVEQVSSLQEAGVVDAVARTAALSRLGEAERVRETFPRKLDQVMPTRLGNALRRAEAQAGSQYNLDALQAVPHILLIAPTSHVEYVSDQRSQLDLAVRMTFMSGLASATAILFLWHRHLWMLIALIPYMLAYLSYRGSVIAAGHYGSALDILINMDRFELYKQLHLKIPTETFEEREGNKKLARLFAYDSEVVVEYQHPDENNKSSSSNQLGRLSMPAKARLWI
jgi:hypothetical protein